MTGFGLSRHLTTNMCGFIAILQDDPIIELEAARRALESIAHRGPDASEEWREGDVFLGHRRLSIIDLATGDQPMQSVDGRYVLVFNGEIYNFMELRETLVDEGASFRTQSDTGTAFAHRPSGLEIGWGSNH